METEIIKYFAFLFSFVITLGLLQVWLSNNKKKRKEKEEQEKNNNI